MQGWKKILKATTASLVLMAFSPAFGDDNDKLKSDEASDQTEKVKKAGKRSSQGIADDQNEKRKKADRKRARRNLAKKDLRGREIRSFDGTGNNKTYANWGASFEHLQRLGDADYADGISTLAGPLRPSARVVSNEISHQDDAESLRNKFGTSDFLWQWGQFIDHDIDLTDGSTDEAAPINVPTGDVHFDPAGNGGVEISMHRAIFDPTTGTDLLNPREQENEITSWIDASMVYGSDEARAMALRVGPRSPFLKTSKGKLLPFNVEELPNANGFVRDPKTLFLAGDVRANEQVGLAVMHTLFVREHNRIAKKLKRQYPYMSGEEIYQSARRIVAAEIQIITYNEFLPALLGPKAMKRKYRYDPSINPTIFNEFSAAAFRLGHSMLSPKIKRVNARGRKIRDGHLALRDAFFVAPSLLTKKNDIDPILRGLASQRHQTIDVKVVSDVRNFLFGRPGAGGLDLASLNIQRGRDHGLGSYNDTREAMGLTRAQDFSDITSDTELQDALYRVYGNVDDVDLWVGGLAEDPLAKKGSQLGPLFRAILIKQFEDLRAGDRFWYENNLTRRERRMVKGTTLAKIIRANTTIGDELQDNVFYVKRKRRW